MHAAAGAVRAQRMSSEVTEVRCRDDAPLDRRFEVLPPELGHRPARGALLLVRDVGQGRPSEETLGRHPVMHRSSVSRIDRAAG